MLRRKISPRAIAIMFAALGGLAPGAWGQSATFTTSTTIGATDLTYEGYDIVVQGCTLTINGAHSFSSLTVQRNGSNQPGIVTHAAGFTSGSVAGLSLSVLHDVTIEGAAGTLVASRIDADAKGLAAGTGPGLSGAAGTGTCCGRGGSGHGGPGGAGTTFGGGPTYGNDAQPVVFGSGGTPRFSGAAAGVGGGCIRLNVGGTLTVDGVITASGGTCTGDNGAPSGGSILLRCPVVRGAGTIAARGGSNLSAQTGGGGGGGRISINACQFQISFARVDASGGAGFQAGVAGSVFLGSSGVQIVQQPTARAAVVGDTVVLSVSATGTGGLGYQWRRNATPLVEDGRISGVTGPVLTIGPAVEADSGSYDVVVFDSCGPYGSASAAVDVCCRADRDRNHATQPADVSLFVQQWFASVGLGTTEGDFDGSGVVDPADIALFVQVWLATVQAGGCS